MYRELVQQAAKELNLPFDLVNTVYQEYWKAVKAYVESMPFDQDRIMTEEEFNACTPDIMILGLGKLFVPYKQYVKVKTNVLAKRKREREQENAAYKEC